MGTCDYRGVQKLAVLLFAGVWASGLTAQGQELTVSIGTVTGPAWRASDVSLTYLSPSAFRLSVAFVDWAGRPAVNNLQVDCAAPLTGTALRCEHGRFRATIAGWGRQEGSLDGAFVSAGNWRARLEVPRRGLVATLEQSGADMKVSARMRGQKIEDLRALAAAFGQTVPGEFSGVVDLTLSARLGPAASTANVQMSTGSLNYQEPSGRYAAENLAARAVAHWDSGPQRWTLGLEGHAGQAYAEPLFLDFTALPSTAEVVAQDSADHWRIERLHVQQGTAGTFDATSLIAKAGLALESAEIAFDAPALAPVVATDVQPFVIGTPLDGLIAQGAVRGTVSLRGGSMTALAAELSGVTLTAGRLGLSLQNLSGKVRWAGVDAAPSSVQWSVGTLGRIPFGPSEVSFRAQGQDLELLAPWRQSLLEGAVRVERLALRNLGLPQMDVDFRGVLEPIDLAALCRALDWPVFGGTLGGQLPGLRVQNDVWSIDGLLEAQVFNGTVRLENLKAIEPFGALPRVAADAYLRRLELELLTGTFEFGRITGRLDGDIKALRLLNWKPVAFDARLYSAPGDDTRRRISQRAIDSISAIGGGPTGLLSRGFLGVFKDFSYDRMGIGCVLRDSRCQMDGIEPTPPAMAAPVITWSRDACCRALTSSATHGRCRGTLWWSRSRQRSPLAPRRPNSPDRSRRCVGLNFSHADGGFHEAGNDCVCSGDGAAVRGLRDDQCVFPGGGSREGRRSHHR
ncbi:hypothetical protein [Immundisolibacter sp.]